MFFGGSAFLPSSIRRRCPVRRPLLALALALRLSLGVETPKPEWKEVELELRGDVKFRGEILSLRDSSIVVALKGGLSDSELQEGQNLIRVIAKRDILALRTTEGPSSVLPGLAGGSFVGCVIGLGIGASVAVDRSPKDTFGCEAQDQRIKNETNGSVIGALAGAALGALIGGSIGSEDDLITPQKRDFHLLYRLARYIHEPEFLQSVGQRRIP
jgi:outer membrane lipoprotein SlyB